jgi:large subunit ribosomal protein L35
MRSLLSLLVLCFACSASAFAAAPAGALIRSPAVAASPAVVMSSVNRQAKAACRKQKSKRAAVKRFKVTSTGKLLRHYAGKAHLLRKKRPQHLAKLRRVGQCDDSQLDTYQRLLLVFPKCVHTRAVAAARVAVFGRRGRRTTRSCLHTSRAPHPASTNAALFAPDPAAGRSKCSAAANRPSDPRRAMCMMCDGGSHTASATLRT